MKFPENMKLNEINNWNVKEIKKNQNRNNRDFQKKNLE